VGRTVRGSGLLLQKLLIRLLLLLDSAGRLLAVLDLGNRVIALHHAKSVIVLGLHVADAKFALRVMDVALVRQAVSGEHSTASLRVG